MIVRICSLLITLCLAIAFTTGSVYAQDPAPQADAGTEQGTSEPAQAANASDQATQETGKMIDLTNPQEALNPDTWLNLLNLIKEWVVTYGPSLIVAIIILIIGRWLAMWLAGMVQKTMTRGKVDVTLASFLSKLVYYALLAAVVIAAADQLGIKTTSFIAIIGAAGLAVGLALKDSLSNFASGVMLILFRPFTVGDVVTAGGVMGKVSHIDIFSTVIHTPDNQKIIVPNSRITTDVITNVNAEPTRRIDLTVGIGYDDDIRVAKAVLEELVLADKRILAEPAAAIAVAELADSSVNLIVRPWVISEDYWDVRLELIEKIKLAFDERGISIPYPQSEVHMHQVPST